MNEQYEPIKFESWQELAKYVIDGGEVFIKNNGGNHVKIVFDGRCFNNFIHSWMEDLYIKKQPTLQELIAIKPRLFWFWIESDDACKQLKLVDDYYILVNSRNRYRMLTDDEIKQFLSE